MFIFLRNPKHQKFPRAKRCNNPTHFRHSKVNIGSLNRPQFIRDKGGIGHFVLTTNKQLTKIFPKTSEFPIKPPPARTVFPHSHLCAFCFTNRSPIMHVRQTQPP
ncbi:hypothetical protein GWI33_015364 [Rhynchophorus ferrugineus]|uniref:Uncharacterized protein n=1 Tax=Rhynchophorus ferrugineus TaxID=354439 RepID=A0A834M862_RHYFE|nr:hypothetical protein GWI33_015364 [Rhynchophorus ferrugineus]